MQGLGPRGATPLDGKAALYRGRDGRRPRFARVSFTLLALIVVSAFVYTQLAPKSALGRTLQDAAALYRGRGGRRPRFARASFTLLALIVVSAFVYTQLAPKSALGRTLQDAAARLREGWQQMWPTLERQLGNITELAKESQSDTKLRIASPR